MLNLHDILIGIIAGLVVTIVVDPALTNRIAAAALRAAGGVLKGAFAFLAETRRGFWLERYATACTDAWKAATDEERSKHWIGQGILAVWYLFARMGVGFAMGFLPYALLLMALSMVALLRKGMFTHASLELQIGVFIAVVLGLYASLFLGGALTTYLFRGRVGPALVVPTIVAAAMPAHYLISQTRPDLIAFTMTALIVIAGGLGACWMASIFPRLAHTIEQIPETWLP